MTFDNDATEHADKLIREFGIVGANETDLEIIRRALAIAYLEGDIRATRAAMSTPEPQSLRVKP